MAVLLKTQARKAAAVQPVRLWDPVVRLAHWGIAVVVLVNAVLTEGGSRIHVWAGWVGLALLVLRLIWGLIGTAEARFTAFPPNPMAALRHLGALLRGRVAEHSSHNPAGALMAYALWGTLAVLMASGLYMTGGLSPKQLDAQRAAVAAGDWSVMISDDEEDGALGDVVEEVHEAAGNLILFLVLLHVGGVVVESRALRRNLVNPMLFGPRE
jgi:cytochrome b